LPRGRESEGKIKKKQGLLFEKLQGKQEGTRKRSEGRGENPKLRFAGPVGFRSLQSKEANMRVLIRSTV